MIRFANLIFYFLYKFELKTQDIINYPFLKFLRHPRVIEAYRKRGVKDPANEVLNALNNPKGGPSSLLASIHAGMLLFLLVVGFLSVFFYLLRLEVYLSHIHYILLLAAAYWVDHLIFYRGKKYLTYFKEFEKMTPNQKVFFGWVSFFVVIGIWAFGIVSWFELRSIVMHPEFWGLTPIINS